MKLSTKGRYGLRLMMDLVSHPGKPVLLKDIAKRQGISEKYLWQVIAPLKNAGMVNSYRGLKGGYMLAKDSANISVKDILLVLEGNMCLADCVSSPSVCPRSDDCVARDVWGEASAAMIEKLDSITLKNMAEKQQDKTEKNLGYAI